VATQQLKRKLLSKVLSWATCIFSLSWHIVLARYGTPDAAFSPFTTP
jgi:hypothetical protein